MKASRIYKYNKTKKEIYRENLVNSARKSGFKHTGSKNNKQLTSIYNNHMYKDNVSNLFKRIFK